MITFLWLINLCNYNIYREPLYKFVFNTMTKHTHIHTVLLANKLGHDISKILSLSALHAPSLSISLSFFSVVISQLIRFIQLHPLVEFISRRNFVKVTAKAGCCYIRSGTCDSSLSFVFLPGHPSHAFNGGNWVSHHRNGAV